MTVGAEERAVGDINKSGYKAGKSGSVRQAGQIPAGSGSTGRGATARAGTLASSNGEGGGPGHWKASFAEGTKQKFRPTTKGGKIK
jgi:hypothetical protein